MKSILAGGYGQSLVCSRCVAEGQPRALHVCEWMGSGGRSDGRRENLYHGLPQTAGMTDQDHSMVGFAVFGRRTFLLQTTQWCNEVFGVM